MISVVLPTTNRPERAAKCIERLLETTRDYELEIICPVDDKPTVEALQVVFVPGQQAHILYEDDEPRGIIKAWNDGLRVSHGDYIVFAADDLWWEHGWLDEAMRVMHGLPKGGGLVGFNDLHQNGDVLSTHFLMSRQFVVEHLNGVIAYPHYVYCCNDTESNGRAKLAGRFAWAEQSVVRHDHPAFGTRERDENDMRNDKYFTRDVEEFHRREELGFPNDFKPVITK